MGDLILFLLIAAIVTIAGIGFGIVFIAPRMDRALNRPPDDEDTGDRPA